MFVVSYLVYINIHLQYCSDLHLEFPENKQLLRKHPLQPKAETLVLAGDIVPFAEMNKHKDFFNYISDNFKLTYWIPGNHEYYYSDASKRSGYINEKIRDNIFLVNNTSVKQNDVRIIFSTLWSKISPANEWDIERSIRDFHVIKFRGRFFLAAYFNQYKGNILNEAFAVELFSLIESSNVNYWIYGHHNCNVPAFTIGKTVLLTNQMGYVRNGENEDFGLGKIVSV